ncbi:MAG: ABC transporter permease [Phycisphaeraceae bacterium]|nr:ABC transporter permease [Phycisphaeraceae bacterium]
MQAITPVLNSSARKRPLSLGWIGTLLLLGIALPCLVTLPWSWQNYNAQDYSQIHQSPGSLFWLGSDGLGRSMTWRCLLGGAISLGIGLCAAVISVCIGVTWGTVAGYAGGRIDALMMRIVDVLFGLPYILLVVLLDLAMSPMMERLAKLFISDSLAIHFSELVTLLIAIGGVSWLTLARVIRGQVLSLRERPFIEAARACGVGPVRTFWCHLLPNLVGPIVVYATLTIPNAISQESFLSFLGIGVQAPLPSWGNLAALGTEQLASIGLTGSFTRWWLLVWPCALLGLTLMGLNFIGDALRDKLDPRTRSKHR